MAELQMKRLNGVLAQLIDHKEPAPAEVAPALFDARRDRQVAAVLCVITASIGLILYPWPKRTSVLNVRTVEEQQPPAVAARSTPARVFARPAPRAIQEAVSSPFELPSSPPPPAGSTPALPVLPLPGLPVLQAPPPPSIVGRWFFVNSSGTKLEGYAPEYVELHMTEANGLFRGRYRARYRVPDRAISPEVNFKCEGRASPAGGSLDWDGAGGAKGQVTLRLLASGAMELEWVARELGREMGLISGRATLVRKAD